MFIKSVAVFAAVITFGTISAAFPKDGGPPKIDIQTVCQATAAEITAVFGDSSQDVLGTCIADEEAARDGLVTNWASFPALAKSRCVQPNEYLPSYVEWTACLEMTRDVIKMRQERSSTAGQPGAGYGVRECPIVKVGEEGAIEWVDTCPRRGKR